MYWRTSRDARGHALSGAHDYIQHFPPGGLPPTNAFWSLTMADEKQRLVANPIDRYSVGDRSRLAQNPDGPGDIYLQPPAPARPQAHWVPAPAARFNLGLRAYVPLEAFLRGECVVPPVVETGSRR